MKEIKLSKNKDKFKLIAYDNVTREIFVTYKENDSFKTIRYHKFPEGLIPDMVTTLEGLKEVNESSLDYAFKGFPKINSPYALTSIEGCIDDSDEVNGVASMPLEKLASDEDTEETVPLGENRANFGNVFKRLVESKRKKKAERVAPLLEVPLENLVPGINNTPKNLSYLFECSYRITLKGNNKTHSIPMYILAESINDLDDIFKDTITRKEFTSRFQIESFVLTSCRIIASVKFDENFPMLASYKGSL